MEIIMAKKEQLNLYLDKRIVDKIRQKAEYNFMKLNAYITKLLLQDLGMYPKEDKK